MNIECKNGIIYEIRCNITGEVYYGSTFKTIFERMKWHVSHLNCSSKQIIERGDYSVKILLNCSVPNKTELRKIESMFIRNNKCVNEVDAYRSKEELKNYNKEYSKKYRSDNKDKLANEKKIYYENNKEYFKEYKRDYYENNKKIIKEKRKEKIQCECGRIVTKTHKSRHEKSTIHKNLIGN